MKIEHIAIYTTDLERECAFFEQYFGAKRGALYHNKSTGFQSFFLTFEDGARLELMTRAECVNTPRERFATGFAHIAISVGSKEKVVEITELLEHNGFESQVLREPRATVISRALSVTLTGISSKLQFNADVFAPAFGFITRISR